MERLKTIILVTHAEKQKKTLLGLLLGWLLIRWSWSWKWIFVSNPGMTKRGRKRVAALRPELYKLLPDGPPEFHFGSGQRHIDVVKALGFLPKEGFLSDLWGSPESLERGSTGKVIILADGTVIAYEKCYTIRHLGREVISKVIAELPDNSLICSGRPVLVRLGRRPEECESGAIYALHVMEDSSIEIKLLISGVNLLDKDGARV